MPPCLDVYVWVRTDDRAIMLARFIDRYVDTEDPGEPRFGSFMRTFVSQRPVVGDREALADLRRDKSAATAFSSDPNRANLLTQVRLICGVGVRLGHDGVGGVVSAG